MFMHKILPWEPESQSGAPTEQHGPSPANSYNVLINVWLDRKSAVERKPPFWRCTQQRWWVWLSGPTYENHRGMLVCILYKPWCCDYVPGTSPKATQDPLQQFWNKSLAYGCSEFSLRDEAQSDTVLRLRRESPDKKNNESKLNS